MAQIAINNRNSIFLDANEQIAIVSNLSGSYPGTNINPTNSSGEASRQHVLERLSTWQGEDWINRLFGIPYTNLFEDSLNLNFFLTDFQRNILQCFGIISILNFTWRFGEPGALSARQTRELYIEFSVESTSGQLSFSTNLNSNASITDTRVNL